MHQIVKCSLLLFPHWKERYLINKINKFHFQEEVYWAERARINWLKLGDSNTKYFHVGITAGRNNNLITKI